METNFNTNVVEKLLHQLQEVKEENNRLLKDNVKLTQDNQKLITKNQEIDEKLQVMQVNLIEKSNIITQRKEDEDKKIKEIVEHCTRSLQTVFTPGQIKLLMENKKRVKWTAEDITSAIGLKSLSLKAYKYLRDVKKFPLPSLTTLNMWCTIFNIPPGILKNVLQIMQNKGRALSPAEKLVALSFDEIYISNKVDLDRKEQKIYGPHKTCQIIMARGLFKNWKQPVFYEFDQAMTRDILLAVIEELYNINYIVVAVTCDMAPTNMKVFNDLKIGINTCNQPEKEHAYKECFITHPVDNSLKIFFFADVPHLLKLARNNLLDSGFQIKGDIINKTCLEELLTLNAGELKIVHKLSKLHLDVKGTQRQKVKLAAQVFSNTNALAIEW